MKRFLLWYYGSFVLGWGWGLASVALGVEALRKHDSIGWGWLLSGIVFLVIPVAIRIAGGTWKAPLAEEDDWRNGTGLYR